MPIVTEVLESNFVTRTRDAVLRTNMRTLADAMRTFSTTFPKRFTKHAAASSSLTSRSGTFYCQSSHHSSHRYRHLRDRSPRHLSQKKSQSYSHSQTELRRKQVEPPTAPCAELR